MDHQTKDKEDQVSSKSSGPTSIPTCQNKEISKQVAVKERRITKQKQGIQVFAACYNRWKQQHEEIDDALVKHGDTSFTLDVSHGCQE